MNEHFPRFPLSRNPIWCFLLMNWCETEGFLIFHVIYEIHRRSFLKTFFELPFNQLTKNHNYVLRKNKTKILIWTANNYRFLELLILIVWKSLIYSNFNSKSSEIIWTIELHIGGGAWIKNQFLWTNNWYICLWGISTRLKTYSILKFSQLCFWYS